MQVIQDAPAAGASQDNVQRVSLAYTMESAENTAKFYSAMMGIELSAPTPFSKDPALLRLYGAPAGTEFRKISGLLPGPPAAVEFTEFRASRGRSFIFVFATRALPRWRSRSTIWWDGCELKAAGVNLISANGQIVDFGNGVHNIFVEDPNGMNLELFERSAAPERSAK